MNRSMKQPWGLPSVLLWPICSWKSLKTRLSTLQSTLHKYEKGMLMTHLSSKRQNIDPHIQFSAEVPNIDRSMPFWTSLFHLDQTTLYSQQATGNLPTQTSTFNGTATTTFLLITVFLTPLHIEQGLFMHIYS